MQMKKTISLGLILISLLLTGCNPTILIQGAILTSDAKDSIPPFTSQPSKSSPTVTITPFQATTFTPIPPTETQTPTLTNSPTPTFTFTPIFTATWAYNESGKVIAPILLYHHVSDDVSNNRYYVPLAVFDEQMKTLSDWGYTAITLSTLVKALIDGGPLPARPVVITFDDGNLDIYQNAFPIMTRYGFPGTFYIIEGSLGAKSYVSVDDLKEMIAGGWEIGSHSITHVDLTQDHGNLAQEIAYSKTYLEQELNTQVNTFAYPYGLIDETVVDSVVNYGYLAAVGLGTSTTHTFSTLYYLSREEVQSGYDLAAFESLLPWQGVP
jgi:peptidoglycan/xylan/chitin deacetylase (PgdA/CDA1 family)